MKVRSYTMTCNCKDRQFTVCHKCLVKDCKRWYKFGKNDARTQQKKEILKKMKAMEKDNLPGVCWNILLDYLEGKEVKQCQN